VPYLLGSIRSQQEFRLLGYSRVSASTPSMRVKAVLMESEEIKTAFALPKKEFPLAVERNLIRRRLRGVFRELSNSGDLCGGLYLVMGRRSLINLTYNDMLGELRYLLERIYGSSTPERKI
jgi:ribonuclease P protein component